MASNSVKLPLFRVVSKRNYAAKASTKHGSPQVKDAQIKTTVLPNKLVVASVDSRLPVARVSVVFRAGARNETADTLGTSHVVRIAAGLGTTDSSAFGITRNIQQVGGNLSCTTNRETVAYTLESTADTIDVGLKYLGDIAAKQAFKPWELTDNIPRLKYELATLPPQARVLDALHKAAYRDGLGNSMFCPDYLVGKHSSESLQHYVKSMFTTNRAAVAGVGVDHGELVAYAQNLSLESGQGPSAGSKYHGGEVRIDNASDIVHVAVAVEGASLANEKEALAFAVLQYALGVGPSTKWGSSGGILSSALAQAAGNNPFAVSALNMNYSDSGLFGFLAASPANVAGAIAAAGVKQLRSISLNTADIARGKAQLKANVLYGLESDSTLVEELGTQAALFGKVAHAAQLVGVIDSLSSADINAAVQKVARSKLSAASIGRLGCVPYVDQM